MATHARYLAGAILMFIGIFVVSGVSLAIEASTIRAIQVDGNVLRNGKALKEGDILNRDDNISCQGKSAAVLKWSNGSMVKMYPDTQLIIRGVAFENDKKLEKSFVSLKRGRVFIKAQVPENIFSQFEVVAESVIIRTQGAEFALKYDPANMTLTAWALIGEVTIIKDINKTLVGEGQQAKVKVTDKPGAPVAMDKRVLGALQKVSHGLGGSLLVEATGGAGGPLKVKIGGVRNRRGEAPYKVNFKAIVSGGSGKVKTIKWRFGDGESAEGRSVQHTFTQGVYGVVVEVEDDNGQKSSSQISISAEEDCSC